MKKPNHIQPDMSKLPGGYIPEACPTILGTDNVFVKQLQDDDHGQALLLNKVLSKNDCKMLRKMFEEAPVAAPVSVTGFSDKDEHAAMGGIGGSTRTTMWTPELADAVWDLIRPFVGPRYMSNKTATDWWQAAVLDEDASDWQMYHRHWIPVGCSPMMRFMRYDKDGQHFAHYDAGFFYPDTEHRTLMSFVIYLTSNDSGATRFVEDEQADIDIWDRSHGDWDKAVSVSDVKHRVLPTEGSILIFDHRLCHDVEQYIGNTPRIIIRGDLIFRKYVRY